MTAKDGEITEQLLGAWDELEPKAEEEEQPSEEIEEPAESESEEPSEEEGAEEEEEGAESDEAEAEEPDEDKPDEDGETEEEKQEILAFASEDPEVQALLAKYQGDPERALKAQVQLQLALGRQGQEKAVLARKVEELERTIRQAQAFSGSGVILTEEQRAWVDEAASSGQPAAYAKQAVEVGEFDLARAVCAEWAREHPFEAMRTATAIDAAEQHFMGDVAASENGNGSTQPGEITGVVINALADEFPDMRNYEGEMVSTLTSLGETHPLVIDARSGDPDAAVRGILGIYEIARAKTATVSQARNDVKRKRREDADGARGRAVVSSAHSSPSPGETPRSARLGPGLTLAQLDEEWDK